MQFLCWQSFLISSTHSHKVILLNCCQQERYELKKLFHLLLYLFWFCFIVHGWGNNNLLWSNVWCYIFHQVLWPPSVCYDRTEAGCGPARLINGLLCTSPKKEIIIPLPLQSLCCGKHDGWCHRTQYICLPAAGRCHNTAAVCSEYLILDNVMHVLLDPLWQLTSEIQTRINFIL